MTIGALHNYNTHYVLNNSGTQTQKKSLEKLPNEILSHIFSFAGENFAPVCRAFKQDTERNVKVLGRCILQARPDDDLRTKFLRCKEETRFDLDCDSIPPGLVLNEEMLKKIGELLPRVKEIRFQGKQLTDDIIRSVLNHFPNITHLSVAASDSIFHEPYDSIRKLQNLKCLQLTNFNSSPDHPYRGVGGFYGVDVPFKDLVISEKIERLDLCNSKLYPFNENYRKLKYLKIQKSFYSREIIRDVTSRNNSPQNLTIDEVEPSYEFTSTGLKNLHVKIAEWFAIPVLKIINIFEKYILGYKIDPITLALTGVILEPYARISQKKFLH